MIITNIHQTKTNLSRLIEQVLAGKEIIIAKAGKPVAKLVAYTQEKEKRTIGFWKNKVWMSDDFNTEDKKLNKLFYGKK